MASPIDELVDHLKTSLHAQRRDGAARVERIRSAADAYLAALEQQIVREFSMSHGFGSAAPGPAPRDAAERLLAAVQELPELTASKDAPREDTQPRDTAPRDSAPRDTAPRDTAPRNTAPPQQSSRPAARLTPARATESNISPAVAPLAPKGDPARRSALEALQRPLVVVGRLGKRDRLEALASELPPDVEWLDTNQHGMAAIGNLDRRIRERRVGALVLVEGSLSHKHTEPLVSAARQYGVAFAYANKGGKQSILRALDDLERQLSSG